MSELSPFSGPPGTELTKSTALSPADSSISTCPDPSTALIQGGPALLPLEAEYPPYTVYPPSDNPSLSLADVNHAPPTSSCEELLPEKLSSAKKGDASSLESSSEERICVICGDQANGVHYNVLSCEGCKSFFLRNIKQNTALECAQGGRCDMDLYTRRHCPACRMKRCLECGMNIKRVWDQKRLKTRKPLIRTKRKKKRPGNATPAAKTEKNEITASDSPDKGTPSIILTSDQLGLLDRLERGYCASTDLFRNITSGIPEKFVNFWTQATSLGVISPPSVVVQPPESSSSSKDQDPSGSSNLSPPQPTTTNLDLVQQALKAQSQGKGLPSIYKVTEYLTQGCTSGVERPLPRETVHREMMHLAMDMFATVVKQTIHFAKSIPGFVDLSCDDQAVLIKASIVDALLLRCTESFELDKGYLENPFNGDKFDIDMMYYLGFSALPEPAFEFMRTTKACGLNKAEFALLTAVAIIAPDRSDMKNRELTERIQSLLISTLYSATKHFHPDKPLLFAHLMSKLTMLRDMSVLHLSELMEYKFCGTDLSPLVIELFGLDS